MTFEMFYYNFSEKIRLGISYELPVRQMIPMKYKALFSLKNSNKKIEMSSTMTLLGSVRINLATLLMVTSNAKLYLL